MAEPKTRKTAASVADFLDAIPDPTMREDSRTVVKIMERVTKSKPRMWGTSIVGCGEYSYKRDGKDVEWMLAGFSPRKNALTLYMMGGESTPSALAKKLGKHKTSGGCLYIKRLADVDVKVLEKMVQETVDRRIRNKA